MINAIKIKLLFTADDVQRGSHTVNEVLLGTYDDNVCKTFGGGS